MIIKSYKCNRFAGIKDKNITFEDNLNVILGPNEAGKSTLVEGIYSVLFKSSKLGNRSIEDKEFKTRFMPIHSGDTIDGEVVLSDDSGEYTLSREWGENPFSKLVLPGAQIVKDEEVIREALKDVYRFGEATYSSIFFSKQMHIKEAIEKIVRNNETTGEVSSLLRKAIMELDGVSIDKLDQKICDEIDRLLKRWDVAQNYPENNKGISNPYKVGFGEVVESFYKKETIRKDIKEALKIEEDIEKIYKEMTETEDRLSEMKTQKEKMGKIEDDVMQRVQLEPNIAQLQRELGLLTKINFDWPRNEMKVTQLEEELSRLNQKLSTLEKDKALANKGAEKQALEKTIAKITELNTHAAEIEKQITETKVITAEDIAALEKEHRGMLTAEARMKAGKMFGKLHPFKEGLEIHVTKDLGDRELFVGETAFDADGYMKIEIENLFELELKSGDIDFNELRDQYKDCKGKLEIKLAGFEAGSIEAVKLMKERLDQLHRDLATIKNQTTNLLGEESLEGLMEKVKEIEGLGKTKSLNEIEIETKGLNDRKLDQLSEKRMLEKVLREWTEDYTSAEELLNRMIDKKILLKTLEEKLGKLAPMPQEYASADAFRRELAGLRNDYEEAQGRLSRLKQNYYEIEKSLPESTTEELAKVLEMEEQTFEKKLTKGKKLLKIQAAFEATRGEIDEASFTPVVKAFSTYLSQMTKDAYKVQGADHGFDFRIEHDDATTMPIALLSTGTYDSVALALRLAILENILAENKGFLILDDCLVDLDPTRKEMAVKIIQGFAENHQVIFTTCNPETARELGGNLVGV